MAILKRSQYFLKKENSMPNNPFYNTLHLLRCVVCGFPRLEVEAAKAFLHCPRCGERFFLCEGDIPFLGKYTRHDCISLMEIEAVAKTVPERTRPDFEAWEQACRSYNARQDDATFQKLGVSREAFLWRLAEWRIWEILFDGLDMRGKHVLDVGAGEGFDSWRFVHRGARVVALEYNAALAAHGKKNLPEIAWFSGFSHILPFNDALFDVVVCNAALHHMLAIPTAMQEFLRVLRPGGVILTACDSFSADGTEDADLLRLFDAHEAVLSGVHENAPRLKEFLATPEQYASALQTDIFTTTLYGNDALGIPATYTQKWTLQDLKTYCGQSVSGSLAMRIRKKEPMAIPAALLQEGWLPASELTELQKSGKGVLSAVAAHLPCEDYVNMPIPHPRHDKFLQQNGWRFPVPGQNWQEGWGRVNSFWRRRAEDLFLVLETDMPAAGADQYGRCRFCVNGREVLSARMPRGAWHTVSVPIHDVPPDAPFVVTIHAEAADDFNLRRIRIRKPRFTQATPSQSVSILEEDEKPSILAFIKRHTATQDAFSVIWLPGDVNRRSVFDCLASDQVRHYCPESMADQYRVDFPNTVFRFYHADVAGLSACIAHLKGKPAVALLPADVPMPSPWADLLAEAGIPLLSCVENTVVRPVSHSTPPRPACFLKRIIRRFLSSRPALSGKSFFSI